MTQEPMAASERRPQDSNPFPLMASSNLSGAQFRWSGLPNRTPPKKEAAWKALAMIRAGESQQAVEALDKAVEAANIEHHASLSDGLRCALGFSELMEAFDRIPTSKDSIQGAQGMRLCASGLSICLREAPKEAVAGMVSSFISTPRLIGQLGRADPQAQRELVGAAMREAPRWMLAERRLFAPWLSTLKAGGLAEFAKSELEAHWPEGSWLGRAVGVWMELYGGVAHSEERAAFEKNTEVWQKKARSAVFQTNAVASLQSSLATGIKELVDFGLENGLLEAQAMSEEAGPAIQKALAGLDQIQGEARSAIESLVLQSAVGWSNIDQGNGSAAPARRL